MVGEVSVSAQADLAGLGSSEGPAAKWPVPVGSIGDPPSRSDPGSPPPPRSDAGNGQGPLWLVSISLLALALLVVGLKRQASGAKRE